MAIDCLSLIVRVRGVGLAVNLVAVVIAIAAPLLAVVLYVPTTTIFIAPLLRVRRRRT